MRLSRHGGPVLAAFLAFAVAVPAPARAEGPDDSAVLDAPTAEIGPSVTPLPELGEDEDIEPGGPLTVGARSPVMARLSSGVGLGFLALAVAGTASLLPTLVANGDDAVAVAPGGLASLALVPLATWLGERVANGDGTYLASLIGGAIGWAPGAVMAAVSMGTNDDALAWAGVIAAGGGALIGSIIGLELSHAAARRRSTRRFFDVVADLRSVQVILTAEL